MGVRTLTRKGMPFDVLRDMSKGTFMRICEDMERFAGPGNKFEPLPTKGIRWAEWPGQAPGVFGSKEIRFLPHKRGPREYVLFPRVSLMFFSREYRFSRCLAGRAQRTGAVERGRVIGHGEGQVRHAVRRVWCCAMLEEVRGGAGAAGHGRERGGRLPDPACVPLAIYGAAGEERLNIAFIQFGRRVTETY